jgi:hypothetical protein
MILFKSKKSVLGKTARHLVGLFILSSCFISCVHVPTLSVPTLSVEHFRDIVLADKDNEAIRWYYVGSDSDYDYFRKFQGMLVSEVRVDTTLLPLPDRRMYSTDPMDWHELYPKNNN